MISPRRTSAPAKRLRQLFRRRAGRRVDDARPRIASDQVGELAVKSIARMHRIADVGPVEARDHQPFARDAQLDQNILARMRVGGRGQRQPRHIGEFVEKRSQEPVIRPEVMAPFRNAMRFVYGK